MRRALCLVPIVPLLLLGGCKEKPEPSATASASAPTQTAQASPSAKPAAPAVSTAPGASAGAKIGPVAGHCDARWTIGYCTDLEDPAKASSEDAKDDCKGDGDERFAGVWVAGPCPVTADAVGSCEMASDHKRRIYFAHNPGNAPAPPASVVKARQNGALDWSADDAKKDCEGEKGVFSPPRK